MTDNILALISVIAGFVGMPVINWLKGLFKLEDFKAVLLATVVSLLLGVGVVFIDGGFQLAEFTPEAIAATAGLVFSAATIFFKALNAARGQ